MANTKSPWAGGNKPMIAPMGSEVINVMLLTTVAAANLAANDLIMICDLPEDCVFVDAAFVSDDLDSDGAPALVLNFGVVNDAETDLETTLQAGLTVGQAGGVVRATLTKALLELKGGDTGKRLGFKVATAAATGQAGELGMSLSYRAVAHDS